MLAEVTHNSGGGQDEDINSETESELLSLLLEPEVKTKPNIIYVNGQLFGL